MDIPTTRKPTLKPDHIYVERDRFVCAEISCAGISGVMTGTSHEGHRLSLVRASDITEWATYDLGPLRCECGRLTATVSPTGEPVFTGPAPTTGPWRAGRAALAWAESEGR